MPKQESWFSKVSARVASQGALKVIVVALALITAGQCYNNWKLGPDIRERDKVIAAQADTIEAHDDSITALLVVVVEGDRARAEVDVAHSKTKKKLKSAERTLSLRPVRTIRLPGEDIVRVVTASGDTTQVTEELAGFVEACNTLAITCADYRVAAELKAKADSTSIAQRDDVIAEHEAKDLVQVRKDSTQTEQITVLKKRTAGHPFTITAGPSIVYRLDPCGGTTSSDPVDIDETGVTISVQSTQPCQRWVYGVGVTGGLDIVWIVDVIAKILRIF